MVRKSTRGEVRSNGYLNIEYICPHLTSIFIFPLRVSIFSRICSSTSSDLSVSFCIFQYLMQKPSILISIYELLAKIIRHKLIIHLFYGLFRVPRALCVCFGDYTSSCYRFTKFKHLHISQLECFFFLIECTHVCICIQFVYEGSVFS